jgi:hypothetical protein
MKRFPNLFIEPVLSSGVRHSNIMDKKQSSKVLDQALLRVATFQSFDSEIDFGEGLTLKEFAALAQSVQTSLREHNAAVETVKQTAQSIQDMEKRLVDMGDRMVMGIACKHGTQSEEYQMLEQIRRKSKHRAKSAENKPEAKPEAKPEEGVVSLVSSSNGSLMRSLVGSATH